MKIFKKIAGILLLLFAGLLTMALLVSSLNSIKDCSEKFQSSSTDGYAFLLGTLIAIGIFIAIIYFLVKFGLKLVRKKKISAAELIDEIGN